MKILSKTKIRNYLIDHVDDGLQGGGQHLGTLQFTFHGGQYVLAPQFLYRSERGARKRRDGTVSVCAQAMGNRREKSSVEKALINLLAPQSPRR